METVKGHLSKTKIILPMALLATLLIGALIIASSPSLFATNSGGTRYVPHIDAFQPDPDEDPLARLNADFTVAGNFESHLPIIVIDTFGGETGQGTEAFVSARLFLYEKADGYNSLAHTPSTTTDARIRRRGDSSVAYGKAEYQLNLLNQSGEENRISLLGMEPESEWILNGSMADKSLMRNYLAYTITAEAMPYVPDVRYCEVLLRNGGALVYQGVYLLLESVKQGPGRVEIAPAAKSKSASSYIIRRDRYAPEGNTLDTYATREGLTPEYLELIYPPEAAPELIQDVAKDISAFERVLYSDVPSVFLRYPGYIDVDSFVDYYLFNEFFTNYEAGLRATYLYKNHDGKLAIGPVWDFDSDLDNDAEEPLDADKMLFPATAPWFERLVTSEAFAKKALKRYLELRRTTLSETHIIDYIDGIAHYLKPARERDWQRWREIYDGYRVVADENGGYTREYNRYFLSAYTTKDAPPFHRQAKTYNQELVKLRYFIERHGNVMRQSLPWQVRSEGTVLATDNMAVNSLFAVGFIVLFFLSIVAAKRL